VIPVCVGHEHGRFHQGQNLEKARWRRANCISIDFWSVGGIGAVKAAQCNNKKNVPGGCKNMKSKREIITR
jgi:hypothetical protein